MLYTQTIRKPTVLKIQELENRRIRPYRVQLLNNKLAVNFRNCSEGTDSLLSISSGRFNHQINQNITIDKETLEIFLATDD